MSEDEVPRELRKQVAPYTQLPNSAINAITNPDALAIWVYLNSKSDSWVVIGSFLRTHFGLGRDRYTKAMQDLRKLGLIADMRLRDKETKQISGRVLRINLEPYLQVSVNTENPSYGKTYHYERKDLPTKEKTVRNPQTPKGGLMLVTDPGKEVYSPGFDRFWKAFPTTRKGSKADAYKSWLKLKLEEHTDLICQDVESKVESHRKWLDGYAPAATTYLNKRGWTEELVTTGSQGHAKETPFERTLRLQQESREDLAAEFQRTGGFDF